jgi:hypothetical protein
MMFSRFPRRALSRRIGLAGALAVLVAAPAARGFRIVEADSDHPAVRALDDICATRDAHARMIADLLARFDGEPGKDRTRAALAQAACPLCGCRLVEALPEDAPAPRF